MFYIILLLVILIWLVYMLATPFFYQSVTKKTLSFPPFPMKDLCQAQYGALQLNYDGLLLTCGRIVDYKPISPVPPELLTTIQISSSPLSDKDKLLSYLRIHSELDQTLKFTKGLNMQVLDTKSLPELENIFNNLPYYYALPPALMPDTVTLISEINNINEFIKQGIYKPTTERDRCSEMLAGQRLEKRRRRSRR